MVSLAITKYKTIRWWIVGVGSVLIVTLVIALGFVIAGKSQDDAADEEGTDSSEVEYNTGIPSKNEELTEEIVSDESTVKAPEMLTLQSVVDEWVSSIGGDKGVMIYDVDSRRVVAEYDADEEFALASLYKLFVVYEGYRKVARGEWKIDERVDYLGRTVGECLDAAIRSSDSICAESLLAWMGRDELIDTVNNEFGIEVGESIMTASARQITELMLRFYRHPEFSDTDLTWQMWDSFLNQPTTEYNWRQGLPSGFSDEVKVYNKVGWQWEEDEETGVGSWLIYNDAAIVEFSGLGRKFIVVVLTSGVGPKSIRMLGTKIEDEVLARLAV